MGHVYGHCIVRLMLGLVYGHCKVCAVKYRVLLAFSSRLWAALTGSGRE